MSYQPSGPGRGQAVGGGGGGGGAQQHFGNGNSFDHSGYMPQGRGTGTGTGYTPYKQDGPAPGSSGSKRSTRSTLAMLAVILVLLAAIIGLSAGLGVSQRRLQDTQADLAQAIASPSAVSTVFVTPNPTATSSSAASGTSSSASSTATPDMTNITCPGSNNTMYNSTVNGKIFQEYCGIDYSGSEAVNVGNVKVKSMGACMDACASQSNCTGAGWGYLSGDVGTEHTCWLKTNLTTPHNATSDWAFGVLVAGSRSNSTS